MGYLEPIGTMREYLVGMVAIPELRILRGT